MKTATRLSLLSMALLALCACYPESEDRNLRLTLPLGDMGLAVQEQALYDWIDWLDFHDGWTSEESFEMDKDVKSFYLKLSLSEVPPGPMRKVTFLGGNVNYSSEEDLLTLDLEPQNIESTANCQIDMTIFWWNLDGRLVTFKGSSPEFILQNGLETGVDMDAYEQETGSVLVRYTGPNLPTGAVAAVRDGELNVRFPSESFESSADGQVALIKGLPVGRDLFVEFRADESGDYGSVAALHFEEAGLQTTVEVSP